MLLQHAWLHQHAEAFTVTAVCRGNHGVSGAAEQAAAQAIHTAVTSPPVD